MLDIGLEIKLWVTTAKTKLKIENMLLRQLEIFI